jgi:hypothetical protein
MTMSESVLRPLIAYGLLAEQAVMVLGAMKVAPEIQRLNISWDDPIDNYPKNTMNTLWRSLKKLGVEWIDANEPDHPSRNFMNE